MKVDLADLVAPSSVDGFMRDYWEKQPVLGRLSTAGLEEIREALGGAAHVESLFAVARDTASVRFDNEAAGYSTMNVPVSEGLRYFNEGQSVLLPYVYTPTLTQWHSGLAERLGRPKQTRLLALFMGPARAHTKWHFDQVDNLTIQIRGRRTWRWAKEPRVENASHNFSSAQRGPIQGDLALYAPDNLRGPVEPDGQATLEEGDVLYVPRAYWHDVGGGPQDTDSAALIVSFTSLCWIDVFVPAIRTLLVKKSHWRKRMPTSWNRADAAPVFNEFKSELERILGSLTAEEMLSLVGDTPDSSIAGCTIHPLTSIQTERIGDQEIRLHIQRHQGAAGFTKQLECPADLLPTIRALQTGAAYELPTGTSDTDQSIRSLIAALVRAGACVPHP